MAGNPALIEHYRRTHAREAYGNTSVKYLRFLRPEIRIRAPRSILDYGCGQSLFLEQLGLGPEVALLRYDPAIPAFAVRPPSAADLLVNIDVLEHIEERDLDEVLSDMRALCRDAIIVVDTAPARHRLEDGRDSHVTLKPHAWWRERICRHFGALETVATPRRTRAGFKTWRRSPAETATYGWLRADETARYLARRLVGRHKSAGVPGAGPRNSAS
jgi:hypothetical protein